MTLLILSKLKIAIKMRKNDTMETLSDKEFESFLKDYKKHYISSAEISRPVYIDKNGNKKRGHKLVYSKFKMCSLDDMKDECRTWDKYNRPKSTDGIFYKYENGKLVLYLVEFKGHNLSDENQKNNLTAFKDEIQKEIDGYKKKEPLKRCYKTNMVHRLEKIEKNYGDSVQHSLELKPIETLLITIPGLYKDYCRRNGKKEKDIEQFLKTHDKRFFVFAYDKFIDEEDVEKEKEEEPNRKKSMNVTDLFYKPEKREKDDDKNERNIYPMRTILNNYYNKLKKANIIDYYQIYVFDKYQKFLNVEKLERPSKEILDFDIHTF